MVKNKRKKVQSYYKIQIYFLKTLIAISIAFCSSNSYANDEITWMLYDLPPYFILSGEECGTGKADGVLHIFQKHLSEYSHKRIDSNVIRSLEDAKKKKNVCMIGIVKSEDRKAFLEYGDLPTLFAAPYHVVMKKSRRQKIIENVSIVSLHQLLKKTQFTVGLAFGRSYGTEIDSILEKHKGAPHLFARTGSDLMTGLIQMLETERIDYLIGHPEEVLYISKTMGMENNFSMVPMQESQDYIMLYPACAKTDWGKEVIARMTEVVQNRRGTASYRAAVERWVTPELLHNFRQFYDLQFQKVKYESIYQTTTSLPEKNQSE